jgi:crossover junction endodeoxyribonuclease RuvC
MIKIGVDVGLKGAIAFLNDDNTFVEAHDMPVMAKGKHNQVNAAALARMLCNYSPMLEDNPATAYVEQVASFPHQGVSSMFSFGMSFGIILGVLAALQIPCILVSPQSWKKRAGLTGKEKDMARTLAVQLYPQADLSRKKDIGKADAILIARFSDNT